MKKHLLAIYLFVFVGISAFAQTGNLVIFSEDGEPFYLILNGLRQNEQPLTNVRVNGTQAMPYKAKVIFTNAGIGELEKTLYVNPGNEITYTIKRKSESGASIGGKKALNALSKELSKVGTPNDTVSTVKKEDWYVIKIFSEVPIAGLQPAVVNQQQPVYNNNTTVVSQSAPVNQRVTTTTTTVNGTSTVATTSSSNTNVNMNVGIGGVGANVNMQISDPLYSETTVITSQPQQVTTTTTDHYVMQGYSGPMGCPWPMKDQDYMAAKNSINKQTFEDNKLQVAKQVIASNCLFSRQVKEIMALFTYEESKLEFAKYAYSRTFDQGNYFLINDAFTYSSSVDELNQFILGR